MAARSAVAVAVASSSAVFSASHSRIASPIPPPLGPSRFSSSSTSLEFPPPALAPPRRGASAPPVPASRRDTVRVASRATSRVSPRRRRAPRARLALHHHHVRVCARFQQRANRVTHHEDDQIGGESTRAEPERGFRLRRPSRAAEDARRAARGRGRRERVAQRDVDGRPVHQRDADGEYVVVSEVLEESVAADEDGVAQSQEREREHEVAAVKRVAGGRARGEHGDETGFETVSNRAVSRPLEERVRLARAPIERREDARVAIEVCRRRRDERFLRRGDARNARPARRNRAEKRRVHARPGFERSTRACAEPRSFVVVVERGGSIERLLGVGEPRRPCEIATRRGKTRKNTRGGARSTSAPTPTIASRDRGPSPTSSERVRPPGEDAATRGSIRGSIRGGTRPNVRGRRRRRRRGGGRRVRRPRRSRGHRRDRRRRRTAGRTGASAAAVSARTAGADSAPVGADSAPAAADSRPSTSGVHPSSPGTETEPRRRRTPPPSSNDARRLGESESFDSIRSAARPRYTSETTFADATATAANVAYIAPGMDHANAPSKCRSANDAKARSWPKLVSKSRRRRR